MLTAFLLSHSMFKRVHFISDFDINPLLFSSSSSFSFGVHLNVFKLVRMCILFPSYVDVIQSKQCVTNIILNLFCNASLQ